MYFKVRLLGKFAEENATLIYTRRAMQMVLQQAAQHHGKTSMMFRTLLCRYCSEKGLFAGSIVDLTARNV